MDNFDIVVAGFPGPSNPALDSAVAAAQASADAAEASVAPAQAASAAAAAIQANFALTETIGRAVTPITGTDNTAATFVLNDPITHTGTVRIVRVFGGSAGGTIKVRRFTANEATGVFAQVAGSSDVSVAVAANSAQSIAVNIPVNAGEYIGFYAAAGVFKRSTAATDGSGIKVGTGDVTSFTDTTLRTTNRPEIGFDNLYAPVTAAQAKVNADNAATQLGETGASITTTVGLVVAPVAGGAVSDTTYVFAKPVPKTGILSTVRCWSSGAGTVWVKRFSRSGSTYTFLGQIAITVAAGLNSIAVALPVNAGEFLGFWGSGLVNSRSVATTILSPMWTNVAGNNVTTFTNATTTVTSELEIGFDIVSTSFKPARALPALRSGVNFPFQRGFILNQGQSNATGASNVAVTTAQEYDNVGLAWGAFGTPDKDFLALTVANTGAGGAFGGESPMYGALGHAKELLLEEHGLSYLVNDFQLAASSCAVGAQPISYFVKGGVSGNYQATINQMNNAARITANDGKTFGFLAVLWTQGEAGESASYRDTLIQLANDYDSDLRAISGQSQRVPLICYQMCAQRREVGLALLEASEQCPNIICTGPIYHLHYIDYHHLDAPGAKLLGGYYGLALKRWVVDGVKIEPLRPIGHAIVGNTVVLEFNKDGLNFDTTTVPAQTNMGFSCKDSGGSPVTVTGVTILGSRRVRVTLASAPASGMKISYGDNGPSGPTGMSPFGPGDVSGPGGAGNLRDKQGDRIVYQGSRLDNWCCLFDYEI